MTVEHYPVVELAPCKMRPGCKQAASIWVSDPEGAEYPSCARHYADFLHVDYQHYMITAELDRHGRKVKNARIHSQHI